MKAISMHKEVYPSCIYIFNITTLNKWHLKSNLLNYEQIFLQPFEFEILIPRTFKHNVLVNKVEAGSDFIQ